MENLRADSWCSWMPVDGARMRTWSLNRRNWSYLTPCRCVSPDPTFCSWSFPYCTLATPRKLSYKNAWRSSQRACGATPWSCSPSGTICATGIQDHIQTAGKDLQWLMEKCRYRYHVLTNKMPQDKQQVSGLLDRAEDMLMENGGWHFSLHMYCRLEEEWSRRESQMKERILERQDRVGETSRGLAVVPNNSQKGGLHVNDTLVKLVYHG